MPNKPVSKTPSIDLAQLFGAVASTMAQNREPLNKADTYNKDHGDNMVNVFQTIAKVVQTKSKLDQSGQLASASKELRKNTSGSAQLYADGLDRASKTFKGKSITPDMATGLIQALMSSSQPANTSNQQSQAGGDLLGSLLGSLGGSQPAGNSNQQGQAEGDLLGSLLGSLGGGSQAGVTNNQKNGLDVGDLLSAGMAFMDGKQKGQSNFEALANAVLVNSPMGQTSHRAQSGALVVNTIMQVLGSMSKKK
jgi:hypothetical protein